MTERPCPVDGCGKPLHDWTICRDCSKDVERWLSEVPFYRRELDTALSRQTAMGKQEGGRSAEQPLAYGYAASQAAYLLRSTLHGWVRVAVEEDNAEPPEDTIDAMAAFLLSRLGWLRTHPAADEAVGELKAAMLEVWRAVDRPVERYFAGPCPQCQEPLYARPGASDVVCKACESTHEVGALRQLLRDALEDRLGTAVEISRLCHTMLGELVTTAMIRGYAFRNSIAAHGQTTERDQKVPLYRMGDVFNAATKAALSPQSRKAAKKDAREAGAA